jgi:hypothetical protein
MREFPGRFRVITRGADTGRASLVVADMDITDVSISQFISEHPELSPRHVGVAMTARMTKAELRESRSAASSQDADAEIRARLAASRLR